jgi:hypothetical protein
MTDQKRPKWITIKGQEMDVEDMGSNHVRNTLQMIARNYLTKYDHACPKDLQKCYPDIKRIIDEQTYPWRRRALYARLQAKEIAAFFQRILDGDQFLD